MTQGEIQAFLGKHAIEVTEEDLGKEPVIVIRGKRGGMFADTFYLLTYEFLDADRRAKGGGILRGGGLGVAYLQESLVFFVRLSIKFREGGEVNLLGALDESAIEWVQLD